MLPRLDLYAKENIACKRERSFTVRENASRLDLLQKNIALLYYKSEAACKKLIACENTSRLDLYSKANIACDNFTARENAACQKLIVRENASRLDLYAKENIACDNFTARENAACQKLIVRENASRLDLYAKENIACDNFTAKNIADAKERSLLETCKRECFPFRSLCKSKHSFDNFTAIRERSLLL